MAEHQFSSTQGSSAAFEQEALARFRKVLLILPDACRLHREVWDQSTVLCLDFQDCPDELSSVKKQAFMILMGADHLGLAQAISFRIGNKIKGWSNFAATDA
ncbi:hypothetical protein [[Limnothrix rosea] IAM M-220]|uniref:hypothetical protein n=1 Tax=[Limnothrix rosea] IAM M-220 TaxID=454133 RepID=UPI0009598AAD|nr:hypothetical protein [[Limnothrix rosea] IAM M-220]OKH20031.1 hypothetical protein NIES208_00740 [[Limnothrix rosea] IAM M-220]